jgi:hypothetical protein
MFFTGLEVERFVEFAVLMFSGGEARPILDLGSDDGGCFLGTSSPAWYKTPELGFSRCLGLGVTSNGEACGTLSWNLDIVGPGNCGCGGCFGAGDGILGGVISLGKENGAGGESLECGGDGTSGKEFSSLRYVLDPDDPSGESDDNGHEGSVGFVAWVGSETVGLGVSSGKVSEDDKGGEKGGTKLSGLYKLGAGSCLSEALGVGGVEVLDETSSAGLRGRTTSGVSSLTIFCAGGCALAKSSGSR